MLIRRPAFPHTKSPFPPSLYISFYNFAPLGLSRALRYQHHSCVAIQGIYSDIVLLLMQLILGKTFNSCKRVTHATRYGMKGCQSLKNSNACSNVSSYALLCMSAVVCYFFLIRVSMVEIYSNFRNKEEKCYN